MKTFNEREDTINTNNGITFEDSVKGHEDLLTGMLKMDTRKLIEQAMAVEFAELLKLLQGCRLAEGKPGVIRNGYLSNR